MRDSIVTFPEVFAQHGYKTADFGKIHLPRGVEPWQLQVKEGGGMGDLLRYMPQPPPENPLGAPFPAGRPFLAERVTENGLQWIAERLSLNDDPFLVRFSFLQPHTPLVPRPPYDTMFADLAFEDIPDERKRLSATEKLWSDLWRERGYTREQLRQARAYYCGLVAWVDEQVGRILAFLEDRGELARTVLIFAADHGTAKGESWCGEKHTYAPHVHRVPLILSWPSGGIAAGQTCRELAQNIDIPRTLFAAARIEAPEQFQGRALLSEPEPDAVYATMGFGFPDSRCAPNGGMGVYYGGKGWPRRSCIRTRGYRFEKNMRIDGRRALPEEQDAYLADLERDPFEVWNRADDAAYAATVAELEAKLEAHADGAVEVPWEMVKRENR